METELHQSTKVQAAEHFTSTMRFIHTKVQATVSKVQTTIKLEVDQCHSLTSDYQIHNQILITTCDYSTFKLADHWLSSYKITAILPSYNAVVLQLSNHLKIHSMINVFKLKRYNRPLEYQL